MSKKGTIPCRISSNMLRKLNQATAEQNVTRNELVQNQISHFIVAPKFFDPTDYIELREPVTEMLTFSFNSETTTVLQEMAKDHNVTLSALIRMIIFAEIRTADEP